MLQGAKAELFNPLVPKAHSSECQNLPFPFTNKASKSQWSKYMADFYSLPFGINGLIIYFFIKGIFELVGWLKIKPLMRIKSNCTYV